MPQVNTVREAYDQIGPFCVVIAGTRTFSNYALLKAECDKALVNRLPNVVVLSGANRRYDINGNLRPTADLLGEFYAIEKELRFEGYPAKWSEGKAAGPKRNAQMARIAHAAIVFWDGQSKGAKSMIEEMQKLGKPCRVVRY